MENKRNELSEKLLYAPKNGYDRLSAEEEKAMNAYCEDYKRFLDRGKTERLCVDYCIELAEARGFRSYEKGMKLTAGDKVYVNNRDKGIMLYNVKLTARLCGTRLDLPRAPLAFRLHTASGEQFLLGLDIPPYPLTMQHLTASGSAAETSVYSLEVTHKTDWPLPRIIAPLSFNGQ